MTTEKSTNAINIFGVDKIIKIGKMVEEEGKINALLNHINTLLEEADCGGLVTLEKAHVIRYLHGK